MRTSRAQQAAVNFCILVTITVGMLAAAEIGAFLAFRIHSLVSSVIGHVAGAGRVPAMELGAGTNYEGQPWADAFFREQEQAFRVEYDPYVVWKNAPFAGQLIVIGQDHLRRTLHAACRPGAYTIWLFGGSTMWGFDSPDWGTIPSWLGDEYGRAGRPVCVRNYGQLAWANTQEVITLALELKRGQLKPDLVVFYDGVNEVITAWQAGRAGVPNNSDLLKAQLDSWEGLHFGERPFRYLTQTNAARLLQRLLLRARAGNRSPGVEPHISPAETDRLAPSIVATYEENMRLVDVLAHAYGFKYAAFWQPALPAGHKPLTEMERRIQQQETRKRPGLEALFIKTYPLARAAARPPFFYIADAFDKQHSTIYNDLDHVGPDGNRVVARRIYEVLRAEGF